MAQGDLLQTVRLDVDGRPLEGEFLQSANIVNTMIKQLSVFTSEVTRVAREVGTEGKLGGQAQVPEVTGVWKDLTESVNSMASNLTGQVRNIAEVTIAVANGDLSKKITVDVRGEILQLKEAINTMVDQLRSFASEVTRVAREVGTDGKLGGQAIVPGVAGTWKDLTDSVNAMCGNLTAQVRNIAAGHHRGRARRPVAQDHGRRARRNPRAEGHHQHDGGPAQRVRLGSDARGARGRHRRQARRPGAGARRRRHLEGPHRQRQLHGVEPDRAGPQHRRRRRPPSPAATCRRRSPSNVSGEILQLKETINTMVDQLNAFAGEVTRVAREVGTEGRLGGQANVLGVAGTWKDLTDSVNSMASQPDRAGPQHRRSDDRGRQRRPVARRSPSTCAAKSSS